MVWDRGVGPVNFRRKWVIQWAGLIVQIVNRPTFHDKRANLVIEIHSESLMVMGHQAAWAEILRVVEGLGFQLSHSKWSRFDACVDLPGVGVMQVLEPIAEGRFVCDAQRRKASWRGMPGDFTYFRIGSHIQCRAYDKLLDVTRNARKLDIVKRQRWDGEIPDAATRVEFQLRSPAKRTLAKVKSIGECDSVEQLFEQLPNICRWLTEDWFRVTNKQPDRKNGNQGRTRKEGQTAAIWLNVQESFRDWCGQAFAVANTTPVRAEDVTPLRKQARGLIETAAARLGRLLGTPEEVLAFAVEFLTPETWQSPLRIWAKRIAFEAAGPAEPLAGDGPPSRRIQALDDWNGGA